MSEFTPRPRRLQTHEERVRGGHGRAPTNPTPHSCLYTFFDLTCVAIDYGVVEGIVLATELARSRGLEQVHFVFVPAANDSYRIHGTPDPVEDEWRIHNILMQAPWLCPLSVGMTWCTTREQAAMILAAAGPHIFPLKYDVSQGDQGVLSCHISREIIRNNGGRDFRHLQAPASAKHYVRRWLDKYVGRRLPITITLRESPWDTGRNSDLPEWTKFAKSLDSERFCPIFVRDTSVFFGGEGEPRSRESNYLHSYEEALQDLGAFLSFDEASLNMHVRCALYELSHVNLGISSGGMALCIYNRNTRYLSFRITCDRAYSSGMEYLDWIGLSRDESFPFGGETQKLVWEDDTFEVISREFAQLLHHVAV